MGRFHATIITTRHVETVNFYEDHFGFVPIIERDGYVLLQNGEDPETCVAIFDPASSETCVPGTPPTSGLILNHAVSDISAMYDYLYMEGVEISKELSESRYGGQHFIVRDPNGVLINIYESQKVQALEYA